MAGKVFKIPIKDSHRTFDIKLDKLPSKYEKVYDALKSARTNLHVWMKLASAYYEKSNIGAFITLLEESCRYASTDYEDSKLDQIRTADMMASYYKQEINAERSPIVRDRLIQKIIRLYMLSNKALMYKHCHLIGQAYYSLWMENNKNEADTNVNFELMLGQLLNNDVPVRLGQICSSFKKKDYNAALRFFTNALGSHHINQKDVQLGIAFCNLKLGNINKAKSEFESILSLDSLCAIALISVAAIRLGSEKPINIQLGINIASSAFLIDDGNSCVLYNLSNYCFTIHDYDKAEFFAYHAIENARNATIKGEISYRVAKFFHSENNFDKAFQYYSQSAEISLNTVPAPLYGLGQIYIHKEDYETAMQCFENVLKIDPQNEEVLKLLNTLYSESKDREKRDIAIPYFKSAIVKDPDNDQAWIYLARLLEDTDALKALVAYNKGLQIILKKNEKLCQPELLNNIAALHYKLNNFDASRIKLEESLCLTIKLANVNPNHYNRMILNTKYNLSRNMEKLCKLQKAKILYKEIIKDDPNYLDCYLRLGCIAKDCNQIHEAFNWFQEALSIDHQNTGAWLLLENLYMTRLEWDSADENHILRNPSTLNDPYALTALGNYWLQALYDTLENVNKGMMYEVLALEYFTNVLKNDTTNIWAANGIGNILANNKCFFTAKAVFYLLETNYTNFRDVWLNIASVYFEQKQYSSAIKMYEYCLKQFNKHNNDKIFQWLGTAYFKTGQLKKAKNVLLKALKIVPQDAAIMYNVASVLRKLSVQIIKNEKSDLKDILQAVCELEVSQKYFQYLSANKIYKSYDNSLYIYEAQVNQILLNGAKYYVEQAYVKDEKRKTRRDIQMKSEFVEREKSIGINKLQEIKRNDLNQLKEHTGKMKTVVRYIQDTRQQSEEVKDESDSDEPKDSTQDNKLIDFTQYKDEHKNEVNQNIHTTTNNSELLSIAPTSHTSTVITSLRGIDNGNKHAVSKPSKKSSHPQTLTTVDGITNTGSANGIKPHLHYGNTKTSGLQAKLKSDIGLEKTSETKSVFKSGSLSSTNSGRATKSTSKSKPSTTQ